MIKKIDHVAIAVKDLKEEIVRYRDVLGLEFLGTEVVPEQKVTVAFFKVGDVRIELLEPLSPDSPISAFIEKKGGGLHHLALEVDDIGADIRQLQEKNVQMLDREPRKGAHNARIAFVHPKSFSGVLYELQQKGDAS
ncbi:MAG: methylmalonyl-CoA epimerase [Acidobacteriota bacterium]|jgi:methylmalonyl-CoA/ethylmalonyl-CoA epimerase|nr:methylmalonyl-CoA epimerase [Acidobacteriota bacterium]